MENSANDAAAAPAAAQNQEAAQQSEDAGVQTGAGSDSVGGASTAGGSTTMARKSAWGSAKTVLVGVKAAGRFQTLRDLIGDDAYIEESRLKMMKALGERRRPPVALRQCRQPQHRVVQAERRGMGGAWPLSCSVGHVVAPDRQQAAGPLQPCLLTHRSPWRSPLPGPPSPPAAQARARLPRCSKRS